MKYLELIFHSTPASNLANDILTGLLGNIEFESFVNQDDGCLAAYIQQDKFKIQELEQLLKDFPLTNTKIDFNCNEVEDKDWNEVWEQNFFQPIVIGNQCVIHSSFHQNVPQAKYDIIINPQMAFGTGHHETTGLIINELLKADLQNKKVLDMGCGTSILAILACMRGAQHCIAVDIDEWCIRNSVENIKLNGITNIDIYQGDASSLADKGPFDIVIANINRNILLSDMKYYVARMNPGAALYISGFYTDDLPVLQKEAERNHLVLTGQHEKNHWAMATLKKE